MEREEKSVHAILRERGSGCFGVDHAAGVFHDAERSANAEYDPGDFQESEGGRAGQRWFGVPLSPGTASGRFAGRRGHVQYVLVLAGGSNDASGDGRSRDAESGAIAV